MMQGVSASVRNNSFPVESGTSVKSLSGSARVGFIRKVYYILCIQLLVTALFIIIGAASEQYQDFVKENIVVYILAVVGYIASVCALICNRKLARKVPANYILMGILTVCMSYMTTMTTVYYPTEILIYAAILTALMVIALTLYAFTTKTDFTMMGGLLFVGSLVLIGGSIAQIFLQVG